jgi:hypothetical protein
MGHLRQSNPRWQIGPSADGTLNGAPIAGDGFFFFEVRKQSSKPWVSRLITPYTVFFALACAVSLASIATKSRLLLLKLKSRFAVHEVARSNKRLSIGGVAISPGLSRVLSHSVADLATIAELRSKFDEHRMHRYLAYCHIACALLEDVPMGTPRMASCVQPSQRCSFPRLGVSGPE